MKLIFLALSLSAIAQRLNSVQADENDFEDSFLHYRAVLLLYHQHNSKVVQFFDAMKECNQTWNVSLDEVAELIRPKILDFVYTNETSKPAKCMQDCMLRKLGVMEDSGFQADVYMTDIIHLLFDLTLDEISLLTPTEREAVSNAIELLSFDYSYDLIEEYELATDACEDIKDPNDDNCEASYSVVRCVTNKFQERGRYNATFYPINYKPKKM